MIDYEKVVHGLIDPLVEHRDSIMIRELPGSNEKDVSLLIVAEDDDTARLIGKEELLLTLYAKPSASQEKLTIPMFVSI